MILLAGFPERPQNEHGSGTRCDGQRDAGHPKCAFHERERRNSEKSNYSRESHPLATGTVIYRSLQRGLVETSQVTTFYLRALDDFARESGDDLVVLFQQRRRRKRGFPANRDGLNPPTHGIPFRGRGGRPIRTGVLTADLVFSGVLIIAATRSQLLASFRDRRQGWLLALRLRERSHCLPASAHPHRRLLHLPDEFQSNIGRRTHSVRRRG